MSFKPTAYLVAGPGFRRTAWTDDEAMLLREAGEGRTVQAMVLWAECARAGRVQRDALEAQMRTEKAAILAEAEIIIAGLQAEVSVLRHRARQVGQPPGEGV